MAHVCFNHDQLSVFVHRVLKILFHGYSVTDESKKKKKKSNKENRCAVHPASQPSANSVSRSEATALGVGGVSISFTQANCAAR